MEEKIGKGISVINDRACTSWEVGDGGTKHTKAYIKASLGSASILHTRSNIICVDQTEICPEFSNFQ